MQVGNMEISFHRVLGVHRSHCQQMGLRPTCHSRQQVDLRQAPHNQRPQDLRRYAQRPGDRRYRQRVGMERGGFALIQCPPDLVCRLAVRIGNLVFFRVPRKNSR